MGLDNGIYLRGYKGNMSLKENEVITQLDGRIDVCYWRKCHGLRHLILEAIGGNGYCGDYELTCEGVRNIINVLRSMNKHTWTDSIWSWKEYKHIIRNDINKLYFVLAKMECCPDLHVYFYDSY